MYYKSYQLRIPYQNVRSIFMPKVERFSRIFCQVCANVLLIICDNVEGILSSTIIYLFMAKHQK